MKAIATGDVLLPVDSLKESTALFLGHDIRCSQCHNPKVIAVCCGCAKFLCVTCAKSPGFFYTKRLPAKLPAQGQRPQKPIFCKDHWPPRVSPAAIGFTVCLFLSFAAIVNASPIIVVFIGLAILLKAQQDRIDKLLVAASTDQTTYGVLPVYAFEISERLQIDFNLGIVGKKYAEVTVPKGDLTIVLGLDEDEKKRFSGDISFQKCKHLHAGFVQLGPLDGLSLNLGAVVVPHAAMALHGPVPVDLESIINEQRSIGKKFEYTGLVIVKSSTKVERPLPLMIVPNETASVLNSHAWGLSFKLRDPQARKIVLKRLTLIVPPELEGVAFTDGLFAAERSEISWKDVRVPSEGAACISVEFLRPIYQAAEIECVYTIEMEGATVSGLDVHPQHVWYLTGARVDPNRVSVKRSVTISGTIRAATRLQPKRQEVISQRHKILPGLQLTVPLAHSLIEALSHRGVYAKDISQAPTFVALGSDESSISRYWEIMGRYYIKNQPFDIHVIFAGAETGTKDEESCRSDLSVDIIVRSLSQLQFVRGEKQDAEALAHDLMLSIDEVVKEKRPT